jgi:mevalonate kinase
VDARDHPRILQTISDYGDLLAGLGPESASDGSRRIAELVHAARRAGAGAKGSGAVGGDSAIAVGFERATLAMVEENWRQLGAEVLGVGVDVRGVRKEVDLARRHH